MNITLYFDPLCPWCWITNAWVTSVAKDRSLTITHKPISLKLKNGEMPEPWSTRADNSLRMLRVAAYIQSKGRQEAVAEFYKQLGAAIHKEGLLMQDNPDIEAAVTLALTAAELDTSWLAALDNDELTPMVQKSTNEAIALAGENVGTPIISIRDDTENEVALFGPVISKLPSTHQEALELWDAYVTFATKPYFWELKRTRHEEADTGSTFS